mgnify:CR=1 FL=1
MLQNSILEGYWDEKWLLLLMWSWVEECEMGSALNLFVLCNAFMAEIQLGQSLKKIKGGLEIKGQWVG